jgi:hypothetical protein
VFSDVDSGAALAGIAVIANPTESAEGLWEYSSDGTSWFAIGAVSEGSGALVLGADAQLRFSPAPLSSGSSELQVRGLDDSYSGGFSSTLSGAEQRVQLADPSFGGVSPLAANVSALAASVTPPPGAGAAAGAGHGDTCAGWARNGHGGGGSFRCGARCDRCDRSCRRGRGFRAGARRLACAGRARRTADG